VQSKGRQPPPAKKTLVRLHVAVGNSFPLEALMLSLPGAVPLNENPDEQECKHGDKDGEHGGIQNPVTCK
jgi:hypothetical protein